MLPGIPVQVVLEHLLLPPGGGLLLMLFGLLLRPLWRAMGRLLLLFGFLFALGTSLPVLSQQLVATLERPHAHTVLPLERADVLVVLGAGRVYAQREYASDVPSALALERLRYAVRLHRRTDLPILFSGGSPAPADQRSEAELMADVLLGDYRISPRWLETKSRNTCENAARTAEILSEEGLTRVFVVTHAAHMTRALGCFRAAGLSPLPAPMGFRGPRAGPYLVSDFLPRVDAIETSRLALREWAARLAGGLRRG
jgi:uncharacterized SAM-binding protein YcdF (DUF218 family)